jgi:IS1 family transposase
MWSSVGNKGNKQLVGLALDWKSREIVGCYVGVCSGDGARGLWQSLPSVYKQ